MNRALLYFLAAETGRSAQDLKALLGPHYKPLGAFLRIKGCPEGEVEDLVQETFLAFLASPRGGDDFPSPAKLRNYLLTIGVNKLRDYFRRTGTVKKHVMKFSSPQDLTDALDRVESSLSGPETALLEKEDQELVGACVLWTLENLPEHYRQVLTWRFHDGLDTGDLATRLGLSPKGLESLLTRAKTRFRKDFEGFYAQAKESRPAHVYNRKDPL